MLRFDVTTNDWVIFAPRRSQRPSDFQQLPKPSPPDSTSLCPFCPGNEGLTPPEVFAIRDGSELLAVGVDQLVLHAWRERHFAVRRPDPVPVDVKPAAVVVDDLVAAIAGSVRLRRRPRASFLHEAPSEVVVPSRYQVID